MPEKEIGEIFIYFARVGVAAVRISGSLKAGDTIHIKGHTTDFTQTLESMQADNKPIAKAKSGDEVGIKVKDRVRKHDKVFLVK